MLSEGIYFSLNLGFFTTLLWSLFSINAKQPTEKVKKLGFFLVYSGLFYYFFYFFNHTDFGIYRFKKLFFGNFIFFILITFTIWSFYIYIQKKKIFFTIIMFLYSPFIFLYFFGMETFSFLGSEFGSLSLLKTQNPIIFTSCLFLLLIKDRKFVIIIFLFLLITLIYIRNHRFQHYSSEENAIYSRYIPYEFFFNKDSFLMEDFPQGPNLRDLRGGLYIEKRSDSPDSDRLYQFNLRNVRKTKGKTKRLIQETVFEFEFPIVYKEKKKIKIYELSRTFDGITKTAIIDRKKGEKKIVGPIF